MGSRRAKGKVGVGDVAPDFTLPSHSGEEVSLGDFVGRKRAIVLFFYPKDETPGCTKEACSFRDGYEQFEKLEAEVIGISSDSNFSPAIRREARPALHLTQRRGRRGEEALRGAQHVRSLPRASNVHHRRGGGGEARLLLPTPGSQARRRSP